MKKASKIKGCESYMWRKTGLCVEISGLPVEIFRVMCGDFRGLMWCFSGLKVVFFGTESGVFRDCGEKRGVTVVFFRVYKEKQRKIKEFI